MPSPEIVEMEKRLMEKAERARKKKAGEAFMQSSSKKTPLPLPWWEGKWRRLKLRSE